MSSREVKVVLNFGSFFDSPLDIQLWNAQYAIVGSVRGISWENPFFRDKMFKFREIERNLFRRDVPMFQFWGPHFGGRYYHKKFLRWPFYWGEWSFQLFFSFSLSFSHFFFLHELCNELNCPLALLKSPIVKQSLFFHIVLHWKLCAKETVCFLQLICDWGICRIREITFLIT